MRTSVPVLVALLATALTGCRPASPSAIVAPPAEAGAVAATGTPAAVSVTELQQLRATGQVPVLVDVRTPEEYAAGHVEGAVLVPLQELESRLAELEPWRDGPIYLVCRSGNRSGVAADLLEQRGFDAVNVTGGTGAWIRAGFDVVQ